MVTGVAERGFEAAWIGDRLNTRLFGALGLAAAALAISSTDVRGRVHEGRPIRYLVPEGVKSYIEKAELYR